MKNTSEISELCHSIGALIFVTKNGYGDMVVMSMEAYEAWMRMLDLYAKLADTEEQVKASQTRNADASVKGLREKYSL